MLRTALLFVRSAVRLVYTELPELVAVCSSKQALCNLVIVSQMSSISRHPQGRHPTSRAAGLVDAVGGDGFVSAGGGGGEQTATGSGSSAYTSRTALPTKRSAVRSTNLSVTKRACWRSEMWPRRQDTVSRPARKPTALCPVDGLCFWWVPSARAKRHS